MLGRGGVGENIALFLKPRGALFRFFIALRSLRAGLRSVPIAGRPTGLRSIPLAGRAALVLFVRRRLRNGSVDAVRRGGRRYRALAGRAEGERTIARPADGIVDILSVLGAPVAAK